MNDAGFGLLVLIIIVAIIGYCIGHNDLFDNEFVTKNLEIVCVKDGDHCLCIKHDFEADTETIVQCPPFSK